MTRIAHISRHLDSLIAGIIGGSTTPVAFTDAGVATGRLTFEDFSLLSSGNGLIRFIAGENNDMPDSGFQL